jgi:FMN phosphatase YigB (HAD superfamily)
MIKNIFWDVDGVLANLDAAYFAFLTRHPKYAAEFSGLSFDDLPRVLPIMPERGSLELTDHPARGQQLNDDFVASEFFWRRPLYDGAREAVSELARRGFSQATMSATGAPKKKLALLNSYFHGLPIEIRITPHGDSKEEAMRKFMAEKNWDPKETALIDDRILNLRAAIRAKANPLRARWAITSDLPPDLKFIPEFARLRELLSFLKEQS